MHAWDVNGLVMSLFKLKCPKETLAAIHYLCWCLGLCGPWVLGLLPACLWAFGGLKDWSLLAHF